MTIPTSINGWHNISTNEPKIDIDKVTFEDILSIIRHIKEKEYIQSVFELKEKMFEHVVRLDNPHNLTVDQLKEQVIDIFYSKWLSMGYVGTKDEFIETIFRYIVYSTWEDMLEGTSETIVTTVKDFWDYLTKHDTDIEGIHENILERVFPYLPSKTMAPPMLTYCQHIGLPTVVTERLNDKTNMYENVPLSDMAFPDVCTIFLHGAYKTGTWFKITSGNDNKRQFMISVDTSKKQVIFNSVGQDAYSVSRVVDISEQLDEIKSNNNKITIIMSLDSNRLYGYVQLSGIYIEIPVKSTLKEIDGTIYRYPQEPRHTYNTLLTLPRMNRGDFLEEISIYPYCLKKDDLGFVFSIFD